MRCIYTAYIEAEQNRGSLACTGWTTAQQWWRGRRNLAPPPPHPHPTPGQLTEIEGLLAKLDKTKKHLGNAEFVQAMGKKKQVGRQGTAAPCSQRRRGSRADHCPASHFLPRQAAVARPRPFWQFARTTLTPAAPAIFLGPQAEIELMTMAENDIIPAMLEVRA